MELLNADYIQYVFVILWCVDIEQMFIHIFTYITAIHVVAFEFKCIHIRTHM